MTLHADLLHEHASQLAIRYRKSKPGDVGLLLRVLRAGSESHNVFDLTFGFDSPDWVANFIATMPGVDGQAVANEIRAGAAPEGMVRVVVLADQTVRLLTVPKSTLRDTSN